MKNELREISQTEVDAITFSADDIGIACAEKVLAYQKDGTVKGYILALNGDADLINFTMEGVFTPSEKMDVIVGMVSQIQRDHPKLLHFLISRINAVLQ